ncbi:MAG: HYR domain-containing protein [Dermatophilaceae bacterium]
MPKQIVDGDNGNDRVPTDVGRTPDMVRRRRGRATARGWVCLPVALLALAAMLGLAVAAQATVTPSGVLARVAMSAGPSGDLDWVQRAGGTGVDDEGWGVAVDGSGAATVTGRFVGSATFGTGGDAVTVTAAGSSDVFVARYRPDGTLAWVQRAGGTDVDRGLSVAVQESGAATVTGYFAGSATFGSGGDAVTVTSAGGLDVFVARYRPDGTLAWVQRGGGTGFDLGVGVVVDGSGAATVTGSIIGSAMFGSSGDAVSVTSAGLDDVFLARYLADGTLDWVRQAGGTSSDEGYDVALDGSGAATVIGSFRESATFGTGDDAMSVTSSGLYDVFLARYLADGSLDWVQRAGGTGSDHGYGVAVDGAGAATVTGSVTGTATFGTGAGAETVTSAGFQDAFIARYLPDGDLAWVQRTGDTGGDLGQGVAVEASGAATVTGSFAGSATFGTGADAVTVTSAGSSDVFVARYLPDGSVDWAQQAGGGSGDHGYGVAVEESGAATVTGYFAEAATFGTGADAVTVTSAGGLDVFVARYGVHVDFTPPTVTVPADISVDASGVDGAAVGFTASAVDDVDGPLVPICEPPAGGTFPIGTTTVTCTATDTAGNTGQGSFDITVQPVAGPVGITTLTDGVEALGLPRGVERSLLGPLSQAARLLSDDNPSNDSAVCAKLAAFTDAVAARLAEGSLTADQAAVLTAYAEALALQLGCDTT